jgi:hypothetical protein
MYTPPPPSPTALRNLSKAPNILMQKVIFETLNEIFYEYLLNTNQIDELE